LNDWINYFLDDTLTEHDAEVVSALGPVRSEDNDWAIYYEQGANRLAK